MLIEDHGQENVIVGDSSLIKDTNIIFWGNEHVLILGEKVRLYGGSIQFEGHHNTVYIGANSDIWEAFNLSISGTDSLVSIGKDCLFSNSVRIRNWDGHAIVDKATGARLNTAASIRIDDHVWICENVHILKGATIGSDCVVGACAVVTNKQFPPNCVIAGIPAKVVRTGIQWEMQG